MGPFGGIMTECGTNQPIEKVLAAEDAVSSNAWIIFWTSLHNFSS
jgi:hypothetical protein